MVLVVLTAKQARDFGMNDEDALQTDLYDLCHRHLADAIVVYGKRLPKKLSFWLEDAVEDYSVPDEVVRVHGDESAVIEYIGREMKYLGHIDYLDEGSFRLYVTTNISDLTSAEWKNLK